MNDFMGVNLNQLIFEDVSLALETNEPFSMKWMLAAHQMAAFTSFMSFSAAMENPGMTTEEATILVKEGLIAVCEWIMQEYGLEGLSVFASEFRKPVELYGEHLPSSFLEAYGAELDKIEEHLTDTNVPVDETPTQA